MPDSRCELTCITDRDRGGNMKKKKKEKKSIKIIYIAMKAIESMNYVL